MSPSLLPMRQASCWNALPLLAALMAALMAAPVARAADGFSAGVQARPSANAADNGLPVYPGAIARQDPDDDSAAATLALWGGPFGLRLAVMKFRSGDPPQAVAAYYRAALERYGPVLDCGTTARRRATATPKDAQALHCDDDEQPAGGFVFKAGTQATQRIVAIRPDGAGARFEIVQLQLRTPKD